MRGGKHICFLISIAVAHSANTSVFVRVFHYILPHWENEIKSHVPLLHTCNFPGNRTVFCEWVNHSNQSYLKELWGKTVKTTTTVALYDIHSLWESYHAVYPMNCEWPTNLTMVSSMESHNRCNTLFNASFKNFDGNSTTHPTSTVQRIYDSAYLHGFRSSNSSFMSLFPAASFIASSCHDERLPAVAPREKIVSQLRHAGIRVDSMGKCAKSASSSGVFLKKLDPQNSTFNILHKRHIEGQYMFNLAFENSLEEGYVTEKAFDSLLAGAVPVYLGDAVHLKRLLPHPKAAIFVDDFRGNISALANYLKYLIRNESAYQEHRTWRNHFVTSDFLNKHPILSISWSCGVCQWAFASSPDAKPKFFRPR